MSRVFSYIVGRSSTILDRYLLKQFLGPFVLAVGGFVIIGIIDLLFLLVDLFVNSGVPLPVIFRLLVYKIPAIMVLFFPMATLFAVMLLLVRLAKDNEMTILRASGISLSRIVVPVMLLALITSLLSYWINEKMVPWTSHVSQNLIMREIQKKPPPTIAENVFFQDENDRYFYIKNIDSKAGIMSTVFLFELTDSFPRMITAKTARWNKNVWMLENGFVQEFDGDGKVQFSSHFDVMRIFVDREISSFYTDQKTPREMDTKELRNQIQTLDKGGISTRNLKVEYYMKSAEPGACVIFGLLGIGFCLTFVRSGKDWWGVIFAVCAAVLTVGFYFFLVAISRSLGNKGLLDPISAAWLPNAVYLVASSVFITRQVFFK